MVTLSRPFRIHDWLVQPSLNRISDGRQTVQLEPRVMHVLVVLADRQTEVVSRDELLDEVWCDVTVGEESLTGAISELRRVLGDDARSPRFIETIRKRGYRLVAPVVAVDEPDTLAGAAGRASARGRRSLVAAAAIATLAVVVIGAWLLRDVGRRRGVDFTGTAVPLAATPFTSYPGAERMPAISPDGTRVAFAWSGTEDDLEGDSYEIDIYVKQANTEVPLRLTSDSGVELNPMWSPDGTTISYLHIDDDGAAIYAVPSIGGEPRRLITARGLKGAHSWSPDGASIAYAEADGIFVHDLAEGTGRRLTVPPVSCCGDHSPVVSPDGKAVAFARIDASYMEDLFVVSAAGGEVRRLTRGMLKTGGFDWTRDGRALVCSSVRGGGYQLWRVDVELGSLAPITTPGDWAIAPTLARHADRMAYMEVELETDIWRVERGEENAEPASAAPLISSTRIDLEAAWAPDGGRIAFTSSRSGSLELWTCDADGSRPLQLTSFGGITVTGPGWSPDGGRIAFTGFPGGLGVVYLVDAGGGSPPRPMTSGEHNDIALSWSRDGDWLYFASDRTGRWQLHRLRPDGLRSTAEQVTQDGGIAGAESPDGRALFVVRPQRAGLWRIPLDRGAGPARAEQVVADLPVPGLHHHWDVCRDGVVLARHGRSSSRFEMFRFATESIEPLIASVPEISSVSLSVAPDCGAVLFGHVDSGAADLMLVEGFR